MFIEGAISFGIAGNVGPLQIAKKNCWGTIFAARVNDSEKTNSNDGLNCLNALSPFPPSPPVTSSTSTDLKLQELIQIKSQQKEWTGMLEQHLDSLDW